ncbi:MAG: hypothetical protein JW802_05530 [Campylobacterales bacterium]|nr:hypothetical protein [Campylobacterales bacterium]MBN2832576.1 hypothetical protein [Campylobacterales bacterium]
MKKIILLTLIALSSFAEIIEDDLNEIENKMLATMTGEELAKEITKQLNQDLPRKENEYVEIISITNNKRKIATSIKLYSEENEEILNEIKNNKEKLIKEIYENDKKDICGLPFIRKVIYIKNIEFLFFISDEKGKYIGGYKIKKEDCEEVEKTIKEEKKEGKKKAPLI